MRRQVGFAVILAACAAPALAILFWFDPARYGFYPHCLFFQTTGLLCPGCGALRALHQLLHGHWLAAFRFNALLVVALPFLIWLGAKWFWQGIHRRPILFQVRPIWLWIFLGVVVIFGICRNWPGSPLALLPR